MIDHIGIRTQHIDATLKLYASALAPLGYVEAMRFDTPAGPVVGLGAGHPDLWISPAEAPPAPMHLALRADSRAAVDAFHAAALAAGATDNGAPGLRPQYHADYYGAFVLDLDGNNLEAVCHAPG
jgi:catechol 2,3-dioxygenase-like lactoylglutathione lyase family enzyme